MPQLTEQQQKKLQRIKEVLKMGDLAIAKMILELEDKLEEEIPQIKNIVERMKGDRGQRGEKGDKGDRGERGKEGKPGKNGKNGKNGRDGRDGVTPTRRELVEVVMELIPENPTVNEADIALEASKLAVKELKQDIEAKLEEQPDDSITEEDIEKLKNLIEDLDKRITSIGALAAKGAGTPVGDRFILDDFSGETDGSTKQFYLSKAPRCPDSQIKVWGTDWPIILRPVTDFNTSGKLLTLTSEVDAPTTGATLLCEYKV